MIPKLGPRPQIAKALAHIFPPLASGTAASATLSLSCLWLRGAFGLCLGFGLGCLCLWRPPDLWLSCRLLRTCCLRMVVPLLSLILLFLLICLLIFLVFLVFLVFLAFSLCLFVFFVALLIFLFFLILLLFFLLLVSCFLFFLFLFSILCLLFLTAVCLLFFADSLRN